MVIRTLFAALLLVLPICASAQTCPTGAGKLGTVASAQTCATAGWEQAIPSVSRTTNSTLDITGLPSTYNHLSIFCSVSSSTNTGDPLILLYGTGTGGGLTWLSGGSSYEWRNDVRWTNSSSGAIDQSSTSTTLSDTAEAQLVSGDINSGLPVEFTLKLSNYASASGANNSASMEGTYWTGNNGRSKFDGVVHGNVSAAITAIRLSFGGVSSPTITGECSVNGLIQ